MPRGNSPIPLTALPQPDWCTVSLQPASPRRPGILASSLCTIDQHLLVVSPAPARRYYHCLVSRPLTRPPLWQRDRPERTGHVGNGLPPKNTGIPHAPLKPALSVPGCHAHRDALSNPLGKHSPYIRRYHTGLAHLLPGTQQCSHLAPDSGRPVSTTADFSISALPANNHEQTIP